MKEKQLLQDEEYSFPYHYIPKYKDGFTQNYNWSWGKQYASAIEFILNEIKKDDQYVKSIVDIGCGDGRITKELSETFNNKKILGIDYSSKAINLARVLNPNISFLNIDIISEKIKEKFDAITLIEVFEHIPLDLCEDFTQALPDFLNDNGKIYLTVPHQNKTLQDKHFQHFNYKSLAKYFEKNFKITEVIYIQKHDKLLSALNKLMSNNFYIINNSFLNNYFYKFYKKRYFFAEENNCGRIYLKLIKK